MDGIASFGDWLKQRRKALHLTQDELAQQLGVAFGTLRKWESDERRPSRELAAHLAEVLDVPPEARTTFVKVARAELELDRLDLAPDAHVTPLSQCAELEGTESARRTNLPLRRTPLLGREREAASVAALLRGVD